MKNGELSLQISRYLDFIVTMNGNVQEGLPLQVGMVQLMVWAGLTRGENQAPFSKMVICLY